MIIWNTINYHSSCQYCIFNLINIFICRIHEIIKSNDEVCCCANSQVWDKLKSEVENMDTDCTPARRSSARTSTLSANSANQTRPVRPQVIETGRISRTRRVPALTGGRTRSPRARPRNQRCAECRKLFSSL